MTNDKDGAALLQEAEPDMTWFDIAVTHKGDAVILGHSSGWNDFDIEHWWDDTFYCDAPSHLSPGAYRWSNFTLGQWAVGEHINLIGGDFTPLAALKSHGQAFDAALLDRAELAWQRFFYPALDNFDGPTGDKLPSVDLEVADCLRLVLAAAGRHVATPKFDVPAIQNVARDARLKTVAEKLAAFTGAPYEDWRHFTVEAGDILDRLDSLATNAAPQPAFDAAGIEYGDAAQDAVMRLLETGWATVNSAGYLARALPEAPASVESVEYETLIAAGFDDYAARCALRTDPDGVFCHAYFYSDGQWRFQTGGNDLTLPDGTILRCVLTKRLYARPEPDTIGWNPTHEVEDRVYPHDGDTIGNGGEFDPGEGEYLIRKGGAYYRPNAQGYTRNRAKAGRYTLEEAISHSHPNGPDGPRDGITYEPASPRKDADHD